MGGGEGTGRGGLSGRFKVGVRSSGGHDVRKKQGLTEFSAEKQRQAGAPFGKP